VAVVQTGIPGVETDDQGNLKVSNRLAGLVGATPASAVVGLTSAEILPGNPARRGLVLVSLAKKKISFGLEGAVAVLNKGITLFPGGTWTSDESTLTVGAITAIAEIASSDLAIQEFE